MKTLQELYKEIINNDEQKKAFMEAAKSGKALEFIKAHGCETTEEELRGFLTSRTEELSDEEMDNASGGGCNYVTDREAWRSVASLGFGCAIDAIDSAINGYVGQRDEECDGRLCNTGW